MNVAILAIAVIALAGIPSAFACTEGQITHWTYINPSMNQDAIHPFEPTLIRDQQFWIHIPTTGSELISENNKRQLVVDRLNEMGYTDVGGQPVESDDISSIPLNSANIKYSTECINGVQQMIGGMLLQPDAMTLALAYGIANSIWMAPLAIGIGAGVYLTKSKWKRN